MKTEFQSGCIPAGKFCEMCGGDLRYEKDAGIPLYAICTDSREADERTVFCALRGERVDGHDYIQMALERGCRCILCERSSEEIEAAGAAAVVVGDSELALAYFANAYRKTLSCSAIAVTGSVGKTTTKDLIASVLSVRHKTYKTEGNHNSTVGMPLSIPEIPSATAWAVLEMGMSGWGEIERLSTVAEPDIAVITNIGSAHMEMLGSRENICRAKLEVLCGLRTGGVLLLNGDEPLLQQIGGKSYRTVYVSTKCENAAFFAKNIRVETDCTRFDLVWAGGVEHDLTLSVLGKHNVYAALFAFAIGIFSGMKPQEIRQGLQAYLPQGLRQSFTDCQGLTLIEDCYNASPESMLAALDTLHDFSTGNSRRGVAVLGDMLELGTSSAALHLEVGAYAASLNIDLLVAIGELGEQIALGAMQNGMPMERILRERDLRDPEVIAQRLLSSLSDHDVVLFKASRAVGAERIIEALKTLVQTHSENVEI